MFHCFLATLIALHFTSQSFGLTSVALTLSSAAPSAVSEVRGGHIVPPLISKGVGGLWVQILVATSDLTMIDIRQKDLPLSDA